MCVLDDDAEPQLVATRRMRTAQRSTSLAVRMGVSKLSEQKAHVEEVSNRAPCLQPALGNIDASSTIRRLNSLYRDPRSSSSPSHNRCSGVYCTGLFLQLYTHDQYWLNAERANSCGLLSCWQSSHGAASFLRADVMATNARPLFYSWPAGGRLHAP